MKIAIVMGTCIGIAASNAYSMEAPRVFSKSLGALDFEKRISTQRAIMENNHQKAKDDFEIMQHEIPREACRQILTELITASAILSATFIRLDLNPAYFIEKRE